MYNITGRKERENLGTRKTNVWNLYIIRWPWTKYQIH